MAEHFYIRRSPKHIRQGSNTKGIPMRRDPLAAVATVVTPQTQPVPGRTDQIRNNAGGYVYAKDLWIRLEDFLILGTTGGTYYLGEDRLTADNADVVFRAVREDGPRAVQLVTEISSARPPRAPKNRGCLFTLAAASAFGDPATVQAVKQAAPRVARTTDHLSMLFGYRKQLKGKTTGNGAAPVASRAWRSTLAAWFLTADVDAVAWRACKARQRKTPAGEALALRDILRIAHPKADTPERKALLGWLAGNLADPQAAAVIPAVDAYLAAQAVTSDQDAVAVVTERGVPWEFLASERLASPRVWEALASTVGMTALLRNLARMTRIGAVSPFATVNATVVARLTDAGALRQARIHPMDVFLALRVYNSGASQPNPRQPSQKWTPVAEIADALEVAYDMSFGHVEPSGRRLLVAVDSSGSMVGGWGGGVMLGGSRLGSAYEIACAIAAQVKRIEGANAQLIDLDTAVRRSKVTARTNTREIASWRPSGGGTDLSLPFTHAARRGLELDGFVVLTDGETWAGRSHPFQALHSYRARYNPAARVVIASMAAVGHTIGEPGDPGVLNLAGMDASLPKVIAGFIR
jgi:60 kDa SS-A/Ro ribonucleoprotein